MEEVPSLSEIVAFVVVVERGSFSAAALRLGVAKSSISRRVSALEHRLGARLLQRTSRRLTLTEVGLAYHARVSSAMGALRDAAELVQDLHEEPRGHLRVSAPVDLGKAMSRMLLDFVRLHPEVTAEIISTSRKVDLVGEGFDLALRAGEMQDSSLVARYVGDSLPVVVGSPAYLREHGAPIHPDDLSDHAFVLFRGRQTRPGHAQLELHGPGGARSVEVHGALSGDDFGFVRDAVLAGAGLGIVPTLCAIDELWRGELERVLPDWRGRPGPVHVVYPSREFVPAKTRALRDFIIDWMNNRIPRCIAHALGDPPPLEQSDAVKA
jgi:DNA-binding transcriptional LysR family regulator